MTADSVAGAVVGSVGGSVAGLDLAGLRAGPAQTWGAVRLVPLLRDEPIEGLRLHPRCHGRDTLGGVQVGPRKAHVSYVPHAFVATWANDPSPVAAYGTQTTFRYTWIRLPSSQCPT